jgi:hypothetical protein
MSSEQRTESSEQRTANREQRADRHSRESLKKELRGMQLIDGVPESQLRAQTGHKSAAHHGYAKRADAFKIRRNKSLRA